jgi:type IV secretion system protein VirD4
MDQFFSHLDPDYPTFSAYQIVRMASDKVRDSIVVTLAITLSKFDTKLFGKDGNRLLENKEVSIFL